MCHQVTNGIDKEIKLKFQLYCILDSCIGHAMEKDTKYYSSLKLAYCVYDIRLSMYVMERKTKYFSPLKLAYCVYDIRSSMNAMEE